MDTLQVAGSNPARGTTFFFSQGLFPPFFELQKNGAPGEARTHDLQITLAIDSL